MERSTSLEWWRPVRLAPERRELRTERDAGSPVAFVALALFTFILLVQPQELWPALAPLRPALIAAVIAVAAALVSRRSSAVKPVRELGIVGLLVVWSLGTVPMSLWPTGSVETFLDSYSKVLIVFWLITVAVTTVARLRTLMWLLAAMTVPLALTGVRHFASGVQMSATTERIVGYGRGLASNPNDLALTLNIILPFVIALAMTERRTVLRLAAVGIALVDIVAVLVTFSRGGFLTLVVILALSLWWLIRRGTPGAAAVVVLLGVLALPALPSQLGSRLATITEIDSDPTGSAQERWRDTALALQYLSTHPVVGAGLGMDALALNDMRGNTWRMVHNAYLNYAVDLGLPGLLLFLILLFSCVRRAARAERLAAGVEPAVLAAGARGVRIALCGFACAAFFYPVAYHFYFYYLAGLALAIWSMTEGRATQHRLAIDSEHV